MTVTNPQSSDIGCEASRTARVARGPAGFADTREAADELVVAAQNGDASALDQLLRDLRPRLLRFAGTLVPNQDAAQDIVQDTLVRIVKSLGQLNEPPAFRTWAFTILRRNAIEYFRRERPYLCHGLSFDEAMFGLEAEDDQAALDTGIEMSQCMQRLKTEDREVLGMHYWRGMELKEIAPVLGIAVGAAKVRLFRARCRLGELVAEPRYASGLV